MLRHFSYVVGSYVMFGVVCWLLFFNMLGFVS